MPKVQSTNTMATKSNNSNNISVKSSSAEKKDEMLSFTSSSLTSVATSTPSPLQFPERDPTKVATNRNNNIKGTRISNNSNSANGEGNTNNSANSEATSSSSLHSFSLIINTTLGTNKGNEAAQSKPKQANPQITQIKANEPLNKLPNEQSRQVQQRPTTTTTRPPHSFHHQKEQEEEEEEEDEEITSSEATESSEQPTSAEVVTPEPGWDALTDRRFCIPLLHPSLTTLTNQTESSTMNNNNNNNNNKFNMMSASRDINMNSAERNMVQALHPPSVGRRIKIINYMNDKPSDIVVAKHNEQSQPMSEGNAISKNKNMKEANDSQINNHNEGDTESGEWAVHENVPRIEVHEEASMINAIGSAYTSSGYPTIVSVGANRGSIYGCFVDLRNPQISSINFPPPHTVIVLPSSMDGATNIQNKYNNNNNGSEPVHSYSQQRQHQRQRHSFTHDNDDSEEESEESEEEQERENNEEDEDDMNHVIHTKMDCLMHITWKRGTRLYALNSANKNSEENNRVAFTTTNTNATNTTSSSSPNRNASTVNMPRPAVNPTPVLSYINQYPDGIHGVASSPLLEQIILRGELPYDHIKQTQHNHNSKTTNDTQSEAGKTETKPSSINVPSSCLEPNANTPPPPKVPHPALPIQHTLLAVSTFNHLTLFFVAHQDGEMIYSAPMQTLSASINNRKVTAHCLTMTGWEEMTMMSESVPDYYKVKTFVHEKSTMEGNSAEKASSAATTSLAANVSGVGKSISGNYNNMNSEGGSTVTESGSYKKNFALPSQQPQHYHKSLGKRPPLVFEHLSLSNNHEDKHNNDNNNNINYPRNKVFGNNNTNNNNKIVGPEDTDLYSLFGMPSNTSFPHGTHTNKHYSDQHLQNHVDRTSENVHQDRHSLQHHTLKNKSFDAAFVLEHESAAALAAATRNYNLNSVNHSIDNNSSFNLEKLRAAKVSFVLEPLLLIGNQNGDILIFDVFEGKVVLRLNYNSSVSSNNTNNNINNNSNTTHGTSSTMNANSNNTNAAPLQGSGSYSSLHHAQTVYGNTSVNINNNSNTNNTNATNAAAGSGANLQNHCKAITSPVSVIVEVQNGLERKLSSMVQSAMLAKRQNKVEFEVNEEVYQSSSTYSMSSSSEYPVNYATLYPSLYLAGFDNGQALLFCINLESAWMLRVFDNSMFGVHSISSIVPRVPDFYLRLWAAYIPPLPSNNAGDDNYKNNFTGIPTTNNKKEETNVSVRERSTSASGNKVHSWQHQSIEPSHRANSEHEEESLEEEQELLEKELEMENINKILSSTHKTLFVSAKNLFVFDSDVHMAAVACNNGSICLIALPDIKVLCALSAYEYHSVGNVISLRWAANHPFHLLTPDLLIAAAEDDSVTAFQVHTCYIANNANINNVYNGGSNSHTANMNMNSHGLLSQSHLLCKDEREFNSLHFRQFSSGSLQVQRSQTIANNNIGAAAGGPANIASKMHVMLRVLEKKVFHRSWVSHLSVLPLIKQAKSFHSHHWHFPCYLGTCVVATSYDGRTSFWPLLFSNNTNSNNNHHTSLQVSRVLEAQYNSTDNKTHTSSHLLHHTNMNGKEVTQDEYVFSPIPEHDFLTPTFPNHHHQHQQQMSFFGELTPDGSVSERTNHNGSENGCNSIHHAALTTSTLSINHLPENHQQQQQQHINDYRATRINPYLLINGPTVAPRLNREQIVCAGIAGSGTSYFLITVCCRGRVKLWSLNLRNGNKDEHAL